MSGVLPKAVKTKKEPKRRSAKLSPPCCPEPSADQIEAAERIVAGVPPAAALASVGLVSPPSTLLKSGSMRAALRQAIEKELRARSIKGGVDGVMAATLVEGLDAMRPVVLGREMVSFPDYPTRGAFFDRLAKLTGDFGRSGEMEEGGAWDSLVLRMRRTQPVLGE